MTDTQQSQQNLPPAVTSAIKNGNRLEAIRIIRAEQALSLQEAINLINKWEKINSQVGQYQVPVKPTNLTPILNESYKYILKTLSSDELSELTFFYKFIQDEEISGSRIAVSDSDNSFLVDVTNNLDSRDGLKRCIFYFKNRIVRFSIEYVRNKEGWLYKCSWNGWSDDVSQTEALEVNQAFTSAFDVLNQTTSADVIEPRLLNNYFEEPSQDTLYSFDLRVKLWFETKRSHQLMQKIKKLEDGKKSFLKWKFYIERCQPIPPIVIDEKLISSLGLFLKNPKKKAALFKNLDDFGGAGFSADTVSVLNWLRKNEY